MSTILTHEAVMARLKRMAYEIYERNYHAKELIVVGVNERGGYVAQRLIQALLEVSPLQISQIHLEVDRDTDPYSYGISLDDELKALSNRPVLIVDDVLYTGKTLMSIVSILLQASPESIQVAALIDRGHRSFPISADFVGLELATTLQQHVYVEIDEAAERIEAVLR